MLRGKRPLVGFCIAGPKGAAFFEDFHKACTIGWVCSWKRTSPRDLHWERVRRLCRRHGYPFFQRRRIETDFWKKVDLVFFAGWPFLSDGPSGKIVILHDSLLPKYRGFNPTIAALIKGEKRIGVTAFRPISQVDAGPIYAQKGVTIRYPIIIAEAYRKLRPCYVAAARRVLEFFSGKKRLKLRPQKEKQATFSLWRDEKDFFLDFHRPAEELERKVNALGSPYPGARTYHEGRVVVVQRATALKAPRWVECFPGKVFQLDAGRPIVVCGQGLLRLDQVTTLKGKKIFFSRLKVRFGKE